MFRRFGFLALGLLLMGMLASCSTLQTTFEADLTGANEVPPVTTEASGSATATLDEDARTLTVTGSFQGLSGDLTEVAGSAAHIHEGAAGATGGVVWVLTVNANADNRSGTLSGSFSGLTDAQIETLRADGYYVNVHTTAFTSGEIRGQLD